MQDKITPYPLDNGKPVMRQSVAAFFDILGFSEMSRDPAKAAELLPQIWSVLNKARPLLGEDDAEGLYAVRSFTDNIVFGWPCIFGRDTEFELGVTLLTLARYQLELALNGFFVRGGIQIGPLFMDEAVVFGPALIEAHDLESKHAVYPRIILSKSVADLAREHANYFTDLLEAPQQSELLIDVDGSCFINYLDGARDGDSPESLAWLKPKLRQHRDVVLERLRIHQFDRRIWDKYVWTAQYHNYVCSYLYKHDRTLKVPEKSLRPPSLTRFISNAEAKEKSKRLQEKNRAARKLFQKPTRRK